MSFQKHVLPNGLTIIGEISPSARSAAVGFFVKTGSRDETTPESGVSHFLEHMVFKRSEEHTSELQSRSELVCRLLLEKKKKKGEAITVRNKERIRGIADWLCIVN